MPEPSMLAPTSAVPSMLAPTPEVPPPSAARLQRQLQLATLRSALTKANVSPATADQVTQQQDQAQAQFSALWGYVEVIGLAPTGMTHGEYHPGATPDYAYVDIKVSGPQWGIDNQSLNSIFLEFPPNDPKYLAEFVRAQNYHIRVYVAFTPVPGKGSLIINMGVSSRPE